MRHTLKACFWPSLLLKWQATEGIKVKDPIRAAAVMAGLIALGALPNPVAAQDAHVAEAMLTVPSSQGDATANPAAKTDAATKPKQTAHKSGKPRSKSEGVPRTSFEDRTSHYFDPLSLTLAPDTRPNPVKSQFDEVTDSVATPDKAPVAATPDDSASTQISSASIEQMGKGGNHTVVVPLFQILNNLSPGPASQ
jgi:hypothetical protein